VLLVCLGIPILYYVCLGIPILIRRGSEAGLQMELSGERTSLSPDRKLKWKLEEGCYFIRRRDILLSHHSALH